MSEHIVSRTVMDLSDITRSSYTKNVTDENNWIFELGVQKGIEVPIHVMFGFMQRDQRVKSVQKQVRKRLNQVFM